MNFVVGLLDTETGASFDVPFDAPDDFDDGNVWFLWTDGNYGCDCNKRLFIGRAGFAGYPMDIGDAGPCTSKILTVSVLRAPPHNGR